MKSFHLGSLTNEHRTSLNHGAVPAGLTALVAGLRAAVPGGGPSAAPRLREQLPAAAEARRGPGELRHPGGSVAGGPGARSRGRGGSGQVMMVVVQVVLVLELDLGPRLPVGPQMARLHPSEPAVRLLHRAQDVWD